MDYPKISVTILTKNSERLLKEVLQSLQSFPEVIVYDTGSEDATCSIASAFSNVHLHKGPFEGFGPSHNKASWIACYDWILSLDSDEVMTKELEKEIFATVLDPETVYTFPRKNFYRGKFIKGCGWYPDRVYRLYNRQYTSFSPALVHETVLHEEMKEHPFKESVIHYPYPSVNSFLKKMESYTSLFAEQNKGKKKITFLGALAHTFFSFFKSYVLKRGFLLGQEGFEISWYNANCTFYKYLKLINVNEITKA